MMDRAGQGKQFLPLPESRKYPRIFRLKTASLVVFIFIIIVGIVDICFLIYMRNNKEPSANVSFINQIAITSNTISTGDEARLIISNVLLASPNFYYQYADKLAQGAGTHLTAPVIKDQIFSQNSGNILFLFRVKPENASEGHTIAIFSSSYFQVPRDSYNSSLDYYTFGRSTGRHSLIFSLASQEYLIMNGSSDAEELLKCKTYILSEKAGYFSFFSILAKHFDSDLLSVMPEAPYQCFDGIRDQVDLTNKIRAITGGDLTRQTKVEKYEIYQLKNKK